MTTNCSTLPTHSTYSLTHTHVRSRRAYRGGRGAAIAMRADISKFKAGAELEGVNGESFDGGINWQGS